MYNSRGIWYTSGGFLLTEFIASEGIASINSTVVITQVPRNDVNYSEFLPLK